MQLGLVTYNWGKSWDLPTVIANCAATGFGGVELRSTHAHGVEIDLDEAARAKVVEQFSACPVTLVGLGSACEYHSTDAAVLQKNIEETKAFIRLCHDVGGEGVKVRPNGLPKERSHEATLQQIGEALQEVAEYGEGYGVKIRLEVHGRGTSELPMVAAIMNVAKHPNATVCWNCNAADLGGAGLEKNFAMVSERIDTVHIHDLGGDAYPWKQLFKLLKAADFEGWTLLEDGKVPADIVAAMHRNRELWNELVQA